jgi:2-polyprenyl-3-methyl-5-hydroxy-6-metoxy-1,4-benzoquinol methylase
MEFIKCDLCGSKNQEILFIGKDYRFGIKEVFKVVKCCECSLIFVNPRPDFIELTNLYEKYYVSEDMKNIRDTNSDSKLRNFIKKLWHSYIGNYINNIDVHGRVLDVGCGGGNLLLDLQKKGADVYGIETNPKSVEICKRKRLKILCGNLESINFPDEQFDTVIMSQLIEHLPSPKETLNEIHRLLKPGGKLYIYCPNAEGYLKSLFSKYWHGWHLPFHLYHFTKETLSKYAKECGYEIVNIKTITPTVFFVYSLKSYLWGEKEGPLQNRDSARLLENHLFYSLISPFIRMLDFFFGGRGDCLQVIFRKV